MAAIHLHYTSDVGTTYKRALEKIHLSRDCEVPRYFNALRLIEHTDNWFFLTLQLGRPMRKPRDFDTELKALDDKARKLKDRKLHQLGELVIATGADALPVEQLAGLLLAGIENKDTGAKESWHKRGFAFFQRAGRNVGGARDDAGGAAPGKRGTPPA